MDGEFVKLLGDLSVGVISLIALIMVIRGRTEENRQTTKHESEIIIVVKQLVTLVGSFVEQTKQVSTVMETLVKRENENYDLIHSQTAILSANTGAIVALNKHVKDEFMPTLTNLLSTHQQKILEEFRPVTEKLSSIGLGMDALNKALLSHRESESRVMGAVQEQQRVLFDELVKAEKTLESIFTRVMQEAPVIGTPLPLEEITPAGETLSESSEGEKDVQVI